MVFMKKDLKLRAIVLRKRKRSYREIAELLHVSKSTVSYWFKEINWSKNIQKQLTDRAKRLNQKRLVHLNNLKKIKWQKIYHKAETEAKKEFENLKMSTLFITGISIYWGEGDKNFQNGRVRVSNIDKKLLTVFRVFLQQICNVKNEKIKAYILLYPDLDQEICMKFWSKSIGIPKNNFFKPSIIQGRHKKHRLDYGVCTIHVSDKYLKKKILTWLDLFARMF